MSCLATASLVLRGSVSCAVMSLNFCRLAIVASSATASVHLAPFLGLANRPELHALGGLLERLVVPNDVLVIGELVVLARNVAEELQRRRHVRIVRQRHVIDQLGQDPLVRRVFQDLLGVGVVNLLAPARLGRACGANAFGTVRPAVSARPIAMAIGPARRPANFTCAFMCSPWRGRSRTPWGYSTGGPALTDRRVRP